VTWSCGPVRSSADALEPWRMRPELRPARPPCLRVFKSIRDSQLAAVATWAFIRSACSGDPRSSRAYPAGWRRAGWLTGRTCCRWRRRQHHLRPGRACLGVTDRSQGYPVNWAHSMIFGSVEARARSVPDGPEGGGTTHEVDRSREGKARFCGRPGERRTGRP